MENTYTSLTQNQKLLWIGQELNPDSPMYSMVMTYEIKDVISLPHFRLAFQKLVEKSDALHSIFKLKDGEPIQEYLPNLDYEVEFVDFSNKNNPKELYAIWEKERKNYQFDLEKCAFDSVLIKLSEQRYIWYINQYHLISDGWSSTIIFTKMSNFYTKALQNELEEVETLPLFQDYAVFCQNIEASNKNKEASEYWKNKQKKFPLTPSFYYPKDVSLDTASERLYIKLGKERSEKIRDLANQKGIRVWTLDLTLYNIFLTSLFAFMYRVTNQEQLVIGSPIHNRTTKKIKKTIGFFIETFPLLAEILEKETFMSLLQKVQLESNSFLKYAQVGTSTADLNRGFNVFFNYINTVNPKFNDASVTTSWVHTGHHDPRHHIRLHVHDFDNSGEIQLYFDLNTKVFDAQKQKEVPLHFLKLLDAFIEDPFQELSTVNLISKDEIIRIKAWNNTAVNYPEDETLLSKFEAQVLKSPNQKALVFKDTSLTYIELNEKANQVAHFLIKKGVKKNDIIAISLERSFEMMVYIYGIIKIGATYLPIDTTTPAERFEFIIKDAKTKILLYNHNNISDSIIKNLDCFHVETINNEVSSLDVRSNNIEILPDDLAYIIYTSGSTGEPKGVKCHHQGICNRLNWMNTDYPITSKDTFIQKTPITFDVSLWELFWPLQEGATLVIEVPDGHKNPDGLIKTIQRHKVTNIHFVPSMLNVFMQTEGVENCHSLKRVFCSGEVLSVPVVEKTYAKLDVEVYNLYGPTEASVDVTSWHCKKDELSDGVPIGRPVANTQLYILDKKLNIMPIGVLGELYIAGKQIAKGYLNRENLTKKKFLKDVFSSDLDAIMYKTGDLARCREDGVIEYHGRTDNQVKIRGLRIELGEIEKNIEKYTVIAQAIVIVDKQDNLVAYYTGRLVEDSEITVNLENRLPKYMIPSFFVHLENFEFLSSGKIDRKNLPEQDVTSKIKKPKTHVAPRNEIEELVEQIWSEVLQLKSIGVHDNFITIGGHSLIAIRIASRIREELEIEIPLNKIFDLPTIEMYSKYLEKTMLELL